MCNCMLITWSNTSKVKSASAIVIHIGGCILKQFTWTPPLPMRIPKSWKKEAFIPMYVGDIPLYVGDIPLYVGDIRKTSLLT